MRKRATCFVLIGSGLIVLSVCTLILLARLTRFLEKTHLHFHENAKRMDTLKRSMPSSKSLLAESSNIVTDRASLIDLRNRTEVTDPRSTYYGLVYKDTNGLPLKRHPVKTFTKLKRSWMQYFPHLMKSLEQYRVKNPSHDPDLYTWKTSILSVQSEKLYGVGDTLYAHIQAKDMLNRSKEYGGDCFRARLIRKGSNGEVVDGIPCQIQDHLNGSYTLQVPLLLPGTFTLEVKTSVALSIEGIDKWIKFSALPDHKGLMFVSRLTTDETVECNMHLNDLEKYENTTLCDYSNPRNQERWYCAVPPSGVCSPILYTKIEKLSKQYLAFLREDMPKDYGQLNQISGSGAKIKVMEKNIDIYDLYQKNNDVLWPTGYLKQGKWISFKQTEMIQSMEEARPCFKNKIIYMLGDSTIHQFFNEAVKDIPLVQYGFNNITHKHNPKLGRNEKTNTTFYHRTHGQPLQLPGPPSDRSYISDVIDNINTGGPDVYIYIAIGLHLLNYEPSFYVHRLEGIRNSIKTHLKKFSATRIIIKGLNVTEWPQEWQILKLETILKRMFKDADVLFVNLWDYTTVLPLPEYHPLGDALHKQALLLFDPVCHWPK
ncbi:NXPE family member 3-like [Clavelina lepadiformis]|uniref:NXPE family member 3-like n=1 Tax=Clavelina lepadiformis TaxID=159417 RepID=UPI004043761B